jgi:hypothetical protein
MSRTHHSESTTRRQFLRMALIAGISPVATLALSPSIATASYRHYFSPAEDSRPVVITF